jgi:signal transduction histidine kinase
MRGFGLKFLPLATQQVEIAVSDTGIGIPREKIPRIWEAFEQVDMSVTRKHGGTGLGLNIVQQLVHSHGGTITCESTEGLGTTFTIRLPVLQNDMRPSLEVEMQVVSRPMHPFQSWCSAQCVSMRLLTNT